MYEVLKYLVLLHLKPCGLQITLVQKCELVLIGPIWQPHTKSFKYLQRKSSTAYSSFETLT